MMVNTSPPLEFRAATPSDVEWLLDLRMATMSDYIELSGEQLSLDDQRQRVLQDFDSIQIATRAGMDIGMMKVIRRAKAWHLVQIQIAPDYQSLGLGGLLIRDLLKSAREARVPVALSVLKVNPAKRLYDRLGFTVVAEKEHSYEMQADA